MDAASGILNYLSKQNRPYSAVDIFNNLHKEYGKTLVVKTLETLAAQGKIKEKVYGKQKVYVADQSRFESVDDSKLAEMDKDITQLGQEAKTLHSETHKLEMEFNQLNKAISNEDAATQLSKLTTQISEMERRLLEIKSASNSVAPEERKQIMSHREHYLKAWKKRKRIGNDILDSILEGYPKPKKQLYEDIGIETDEDCQVQMLTL